MWLGHERGNAVDWTTQQWVKTTGRRISASGHPWLNGPIGKTTGIGHDYFERIAEASGLNVSRPVGCGLLQRLTDLNGPQFDAVAVKDGVADFYERTSLYELDAWAQWSGLFRPFGWLVSAIFSRRLQQLNVPLTGLDTSRGMTSEVIQLCDPDSGEAKLTAWVRLLRGSGDVLYAGSYSAISIPGWDGPCIRVVFPLPNGNAMVIMKPIAHADGSFSVVSSGDAFGGPGFYFTVHGSRGEVWARYVKSMRETIHVYAMDDGKLEADHTLKLWGLVFLRIHYRMRRKADVSDMARETSNLV